MPVAGRLFGPEINWHQTEYFILVLIGNIHMTDKQPNWKILANHISVFFRKPKSLAEFGSLDFFVDALEGSLQIC